MIWLASNIGSNFTLARPTEETQPIVVIHVPQVLNSSYAWSYPVEAKLGSGAAPIRRVTIASRCIDTTRLQ